jgi:hypothetical protein
MTYSAAIVITNRSGAELTVSLSPFRHKFADLLDVPHGSQVRVMGEAERPGEFDVEYEHDAEDDNWVTINGWPGAVVRWFVDDEERTRDLGPPGRLIASAAAGDPLPPCVMWIRPEGKWIELQLYSRGVEPKALRAIGGHRTWLGWLGLGVWRFPGGRDDRAMAALLRSLSDLGIALVGAGPDWHPGGIFEYARERGLVSGTYRRIVWRGPGEWEVDEA